MRRVGCSSGLAQGTAAVPATWPRSERSTGGTCEYMLLHGNVVHVTGNKRKIPKAPISTVIDKGEFADSQPTKQRPRCSHTLLAWPVRCSFVLWHTAREV
eukprot:scaffold36467_cov58-Phaeocystis_antarctica.AAC.3